MTSIVYKGESDQPLTNSLLVAEVFCKEHKHVREAIKKLLTTAENSTVRQMFSESTYLNEQNKEQPMFIMNQDGFTLLAMGFNGKKAMEFKLKYIEAFNKMKMEIEKSKPSLPTTYLEALKSLVASEEQKEQLAIENRKQQERIAIITSEKAKLDNRITEMEPKATYYDTIIANKSTVKVTQISQDYGMSAKAFNKKLAELKLQYKVGNQWILYAPYLDKGYVHSHPVEITHHNGLKTFVYNTEFTQSGRIFLYGFLKKHGILPLIERNTRK